MNTEETKRIKQLCNINPEVEEAIDIIYKDINNRLFATVGVLNDGNDRSDELKRFYEGKKDAYFNVQDLLAKIRL
jgi:hypothetical protein